MEDEYEYVSTGKTPAEYAAEQLWSQQQSESRHQQPRMSENMPPSHQPQGIYLGSREAQTSGLNEIDRKRPRFSLRTKVIASTAIVAAVATGGFAAYQTNFAGAQTTVLNALGENQANFNGITTANYDKQGLASLSVQNCTNPAAAYIVMTVSGEFPLIPAVTSDQGKNLVEPKAYISKEQVAASSPALQEKYKNLWTNDGFQHFTVNNLPLALQICDPSKAVTKDKNGVVTIDHTLISMKFEDPLTMARNIKKTYTMTPTFQTDNAVAEGLNPVTGRYYSMPSALFATIPGDKTFNANIAKLSGTSTQLGTMKSADQMQAMLTMAEDDIVSQINSATNGQNGIHFPYGAATLQDAADMAIVQRVTGNAHGPKNVEGSNASISMDSQINSLKQKVSSKDLKNFDQNATFTITDISIQAGGVKNFQTDAATPAATPIAISSPTPTK